MVRKKTKLTVVLFIILIVAISTDSFLVFSKDKTTTLQQNETPATTETKPVESAPQVATPPPPVTFDKARYSIDDSASLWVVANKKRPLNANYAPSDLTGMLRAEAAAANTRLINDARKAGISLKVISGYRSYGTQASLYNSYVNRDGQAAADTYSARPGHSEHQTGLAADLGNSNGTCDLEICFGTSPAGQWLAANAQNYGFIIRYGESKVPITGYQYEPWHIRYVGTDLAKQLTTANQSMEEFFGLPAAPSY